MGLLSGEAKMQGRVLVILLIFLLPAGCKSLRLDRPLHEFENDWRTEGRNVARTNHASVVLEPPLQQAWSYNAQAGFGGVSPLISNSVVIVATRRGEIHALNLSDGRRRGAKNFGDAIEGSPVISDRMVYLGQAWGGRVLKAFDFTRGRIAWERRGAPIRAGLLLTGDRLIAADIEGGVHALHAASGDVLWSNYTDTTVVLATPLLLDEDHVAVCNLSGRISSINLSSGLTSWTANLGAPILSTPVLSGETFIVPTGRGRILAVSAGSGAELWEQALPDTLVKFGPPAANDDLVVVGASDGIVRALDVTTGEVVWEYATRGNVSAAPIISGDVVYAGSMDRHLYALDRETGALVWREELRGRIKSNMALVDDVLVVLSEPRYVHGFKAASEQ